MAGFRRENMIILHWTSGGPIIFVRIRNPFFSEPLSAALGCPWIAWSPFGPEPFVRARSRSYSQLPPNAHRAPVNAWISHGLCHGTRTRICKTQMAKICGICAVMCYRCSHLVFVKKTEQIHKHIYIYMHDISTYMYIYIYIYRYWSQVNSFFLWLSHVFPHTSGWGVGKDITKMNDIIVWQLHQHIQQSEAWQHPVNMIEGSLETKVPTIWTDEKQHSQEEAEPGRNSDV